MILALSRKNGGEKIIICCTHLPQLRCAKTEPQPPQEPDTRRREPDAASNSKQAHGQEAAKTNVFNFAASRLRVRPYLVESHVKMALIRPGCTSAATETSREALIGAKNTTIEYPNCDIKPLFRVERIDSNLLFIRLDSNWR